MSNEESMAEPERVQAMLQAMAEAEERYTQYMNALVVCCQILEQVDLDWCAETIEHTHSMGPILFPTEYRDRIQSLRDQKQLLDAAKGLRAVAKKVQEVSGE